jgi:hypothetical protein
MTTHPTATSHTRCHCGRLGVFGYRDRAPWPRRLANGVPNEINLAEVKLIWFRAEHRFAQWYADAGSVEAAP